MSNDVTDSNAPELAREWARAPRIKGVPCPALASPDGFPTDALISWVKAWLVENGPVFGWAECDKVERSSWLAESLGLSESDALALCEAAGWPS